MPDSIEEPGISFGWNGTAARWLATKLSQQIGRMYGLG